MNLSGSRKQSSISVPKNKNEQSLNISQRRNSGSRKQSSISVPKNKNEASLNISRKKSNEIQLGDINLEKSQRKSSEEQANLFIRNKSNQGDDRVEEDDHENRDKDSQNSNEINREENKINIEELEKQLAEGLKNEEDNENQAIAKFYQRENDSNMDKIYIYGLIYMFDIIMKMIVASQYNANNMGRYVLAQVFFIILERIAKIILYSTLELPQILIWNFFFLDYLGLYRYESQRKQKRNYNLYNVIIKRIDLVIASKFIESCILSGPSLLLVLAAIVNDTISTSYLLSAVSSLATLILANKEMLDFQLIQCKFNSLTTQLRNRFIQSYGNYLKDIFTNLINILAQAGLWMLCTQINSFIVIHAFLSFIYIAAITFILTFKSLASEKKQSLQDKSQSDIKTIASLLGFGLSFIIFMLFYCVFFFLKLKKVLFLFLMENSKQQENKYQKYIDFLEKNIENIKLNKPLNENIIFNDNRFYQFSMAFKGLTAYRAYSIVNTILLFILDVMNQKGDNQYLLVRVISYICSIIIFFHIFQMKRDFDLYKQIKIERILSLKLTIYLKKARIPYNKLDEIVENKNILPPDIFSKQPSENLNDSDELEQQVPDEGLKIQKQLSDNQNIFLEQKNNSINLLQQEEVANDNVEQKKED